MTADPVHLDIRGVSKTFGTTHALVDVSLGIRSGSVHAFVGENGAGKSTLGRIIAGVFPPDGGSLVLRGTPVSFTSPRQALQHGIALVAQELALVPRLTVAANVSISDGAGKHVLTDANGRYRLNSPKKWWGYNDSYYLEFSKTGYVEQSLHPPPT